MSLFSALVSHRLPGLPSNAACQWKGKRLSTFTPCAVIELSGMCLREFRSHLENKRLRAEDAVIVRTVQEGAQYEWWAFGFVPEAWKTHPLVSTQCPDPNNPVPGTCTMHVSSVDLSVTLNALGKTGPPTAPVFVPTPNHDHVIDNSRVNATPIWWEVRPVLILDQSDWPAADGSSGITSSKAMDDAEAAGRAIEVGSNFFLFFSSHLSSHGSH
jgi:hypothetical protein